MVKLNRLDSTSVLSSCKDIIIKFLSTQKEVSIILLTSFHNPFNPLKIKGLFFF